MKVRPSRRRRFARRAASAALTAALLAGVGSSPARAVEPPAVAPTGTVSAVRPDRMLMTLGAGMLAGTIVYFASDENSADYDYEYTWEGAGDKLVTLDAWRFDDNPVWLNTPGHPLAGAYFYLAGRTAGYTRFQSFLLTLAADLFWESVIEFREVSSINDVVLTLNGTAVGEAVYQVGEALFRHDARNGPTARWRRVDCELGLGDAGMGSRAGRRRVAACAFRAETIGEPLYGKAGNQDRPTPNATSSRVDLDATFAGKDLTDLVFFSRVAFPWWVRQRIGSRPRGGLRGYGLSAGPAAGFEHAMHAYDGHLRETGIGNAIGSAFQADGYRDAWRLRAALDLYADFAQVEAHAAEPYSRVHSGGATKSILEARKSYYALGVTVRPAWRLACDPFEIGAESVFHYFDSIEGRDRFQENVRDDFNLVDWEWRNRAYASCRLPWYGARCTLAWQDSRKRGVIRRVSAESADASVLFTVGRSL